MKLEGSSLDQYVYGTIIDLCAEIVYLYTELVETADESKIDINAERIGNLFDAIRLFARECEYLPDDLRFPNLKKYEISPGVLHPHFVLKYTMRLMNELIRQKMRGRPRDFLLKKFGRDDNAK